MPIVQSNLGMPSADTLSDLTIGCVKWTAKANSMTDMNMKL